MAINIKNDDAQESGRSGLSLSDELNQIALRCGGRELVSDLTPEEILGYDEAGIPTL